MDVTSFIGAITGGNNIKLDIQINPPVPSATTSSDVSSYKPILLDHYPSWRLHKNPFWRCRSQQQQQQQFAATANIPLSSSSMMNHNANNNITMMADGTMMNNAGTAAKDIIYAFDSTQDVEGVVIVRLQQFQHQQYHPHHGNASMMKGVDHLGIKVQFIGRIDTGIGGPGGGGGGVGDKPRYDFINISKELIPPSTLYQYETILPFKFKGIEKEFDSYKGRNVCVRYIVKVTLERKFLPPIKNERDIWVQLLNKEPTHHEPIKMEVGIEDCLHIEFEYDRKTYHLNDTIIGKIHFLLVRIKIKHMELAVIRRETSGEGVVAATTSTDSATSTQPPVNNSSNIFTETQTLVKYEIMDGGPVRGEIIPVRLSLQGIPADLTPTYTAEVNNRFSVRYFLNLVLVDEDDRRYFKQQEILLYRKQLG